ncbi:TPA: dioxygenase [Candidatus Poribacteria bacterium]|nr:dioxygenase [Candidatus Poribacteria bacterium]HIA66061.1 dioxygenase [Candidatus Poribacteria bacterium]HIB85758.1 dioxygenase [Candidatus Poribacteria bacterium]HIC02821.1 dioxygenase [Candidatus Poribacteria bacterium]HIN29046.1 dioxygenase [Candidatus Poribacteria bacterium]
MAKALPLVAYSDLESQLEALERDGYAYFPSVINTEEIAELRAVMDRLEALEESFDRHSFPQNGSGFLNKIINNSFNRDPLFLQYLDKPQLIDVLEAVHGSDCHIIGMQSWLTGPGRPDQRLHTDWLPISLPEDVATNPRVKIPIFITTAHCYLNDMSQELGPTNFVTGSHRSGRSPGDETEWQGGEEMSILCNAGDVVVFRSEVWHRGTANTSDETRYLLQVHYALRMITQKFPPYLNRFQFDDSILAQATPRQRRLLGEHTGGAYD